MTDLSALTPEQLAEKVRDWLPFDLDFTVDLEQINLAYLCVTALRRRAEEAERLQAERDDLRTALEQIAQRGRADWDVRKAREVLERTGVSK